MILGDRMADSPAKVDKFLQELYTACRPAALRDFGRIREFAVSSGHSDAIERWDWAFYSEKLKKKQYDIDDEMLKPYLSLEKAESAIFALATTLYGIKFTGNNLIPVYHPEVRTLRFMTMIILSWQFFMWITTPVKERTEGHG